MKIALLGYGKMGKAIEQVIVSEAESGAAQNQVVLKIDNNNFTAADLAVADVAIDFTTPDAAISNMYKCFEAGIPVVVGTTGWLDNLPAVKTKCSEQNGTLFSASNFSIGVNIFFQVNKYLAKLMAQQPQYRLQMEEIHHTQKLDSPSGTAITLAQGIMGEQPDRTQWVNEASDKQTIVPIISKRIEGVPGTHEVTYASDIDTIDIKHTAHSRMGFAQGAVRAAEWVANRKGYFEMKDMLNFEH